jgi:hypothetical protein
MFDIFGSRPCNVAPISIIFSQVNTILSDTNWDSNVDELRPIRNRLCELVGVQPPAVIKKPV